MSKGWNKKKMKLKTLTVDKLHDMYDYVVNFNSDITFLYGQNGCGKTTILNITEAIITGKLFKLFEYKFKKVCLQYYSTKKENQIKTILITMQERNSLKVEVDGTAQIIDFMRFESDQRRHFDEEDVAKQYFDKYYILNTLRTSFNYVYLPLNRNMSFRNSINYLDTDLSYIEYSRRYRYRYFDEYESDNLYSTKDYNITQIEFLIYSSYNNANAEIRKIEDDFRKQVLQSLLNVDTYVNPEELLELFPETNFSKITTSKINEVKNKYISILRELTSEDVDIHNCIELFELLKNDIKSKNGMSFASWFRFKEFSRIQKTVALADKTRKDKEKVMNKFQLFLDTMNSFISQNNEQKMFVISPEGKIGFVTAFSPKLISPQQLSSGEKQLLIFFANLIFSVNNKTAGIFVVDEPELSLHLTWQKKFVERTMMINPNMQLIFATHSPEFVGKYRDKMFKLEKRITE